MPSFLYSAQELVALSVTVEGTSIESVAITYDGALVRRPRIGEPQRHHRSAPLLPYGYCQTKPRRVDKLQDVYGLAAHAVFVSDNKDASSMLGVQISLDGGATFRTFDGAAWVAQAQDGAYCSIKQFNDASHLLTWRRPVSLVLRLRISTSQGEVSLKRAILALEFSALETTSELRAALREHLTKVRLPLTFQLPQQAHLIRLPIPKLNYQVDQTKPVKVYNLAVDPYRNDNLAVGFGPADTIQLAAVPPVGAQLEVQLLASCPVLVGRRDEIQHKASLPVTVARIRELRPLREAGSGLANDYRIGNTVSECRTRKAAQVLEAYFTVEHWTADAVVATAAPDIFSSALGHGFISPQTGQTIKIIESGEGRLDDVFGESYYSGVWDARLWIVRYAEEFYTSVVAKNMRVELGNFEQDWPADTFSFEVNR